MDNTPPAAPRYVFLDTETSGLSPRLHDVIEVAWAVDDTPVKSLIFPHTLNHADPQALQVNSYYDRHLYRYAEHGAGPDTATQLLLDLAGATIVAENYGFDTAFLHAKLGYEPWSYRKIELSSIAMTVFGLDKPEGLYKTAERLRGEGYSIPDNDHTAVRDVECLRACFYALRDLRDFTADRASKWTRS